MNEVLNSINNRVSLRKYDKKTIEPEHFDLIIEAAMRAPTAGNMMTYSIIHVEDQAKKDSLSRSCDNQPFIAEAPLVLIFAADYEKWFSYYKLNKVDEYCIKNNKNFAVPSEASLFLAMQDAVIAAQNAVIAAESLGIGSCYIGDIMENFEEHKQLLNLPDYVFPAVMLCFGYYPENMKRNLRDRFDREYILFKDSYQPLDDSQIQGMFSGWDKRFNEKNQFNAENFAQMHYAFKTGAAFSQEMERSVKEVLKVWNGANYKKDINKI